jgi:SAM-dependent methyltransferase
MKRNQWQLAKMCRESIVVDKIKFIQTHCQDKTVFDIGCIRHNAKFSTEDPSWLHGKIKDVAKSVVGCDYLQEEVKKFENTVYDVREYDITKPISIAEKFDVIVAGDIIEHLSNFTGFFENCSQLLNPSGLLLISTATPFFTDFFHGAAWKGYVQTNPEHTCWICPQSLSELSSRFGYEIMEIHYIKQSWHLGNLILENESFYYDVLNDTWNSNTFFTKALRFGVGKIFNLIYIPYLYLTLTNTKTVQHANYIAVLKRNGDLPE